MGFNSGFWGLNKYFKIPCLEVFVVYYMKHKTNSQNGEEM